MIVKITKKWRLKYKLNCLSTDYGLDIIDKDTYLTKRKELVKQLCDLSTHTYKIKSEGSLRPHLSGCRVKIRVLECECCGKKRTEEYGDLICD